MTKLKVTLNILLISIILTTASNIQDKLALLLISLRVILGKDLGRSSSSFSGLGDTFANFKGPSFFSISDQEFSYPTPPPPDAHKAPVYVPQKPTPAPPVHKQPSYSGASGPSHKCELKEEKTVAMICLPELGQPQCESVSLQGVKIAETEKCLPITRTICTEATGQSASQTALC